MFASKNKQVVQIRIQVSHVEAVFDRWSLAAYFLQFTGSCYSLWIEITLDMLWIGVNCIFKENIFSLY